MKFYEDIQTKLKNSLKESRYDHTIGVMFTAASMAMAHIYDINKAMLAGLLHDCAKCLSYEEQVRICIENQREISEKLEISQNTQRQGEINMLQVQLQDKRPSNPKTYTLNNI